MLVEAVEAVRDVVCVETERLFFDDFLASSEGQTFVLHAVGDGAVEGDRVSRAFAGGQSEGRACAFPVRALSQIV